MQSVAQRFFRYRAKTSGAAGARQDTSGTLDGVSGKKIFIHAINYAPEMIGCAKYTTELAEFLHNHGGRVEVVTAPPHYPGWFAHEPYSAHAYSRETIRGVAVTRCPMLMKKNGGGVWRAIAPLTFAISAIPAVVWRIIAMRPDVVLCVEPTVFAAPVALLLGKLFGARTVLHVQDLEVDAAFEVGHLRGAATRKFTTMVEKLIMNGFDQIVTISKKMRSALVQKGVPNANIVLVRNWVDLDAIKPRAINIPNSFRTELGIPKDAFVVLYAGHIGVKQALDVVLNAADRLRDRKDIRFVIAGEGPLKETLRQDFAHLDTVAFLPLQPQERFEELLALANLHVLPQHKGTADLVLPSKLGGMLASGRPVVATVDPGTELFDILAGVAVLTPAGEADALAAAIALATTEDFSERVVRGLRLAEELSSRRLLPQFADVLSGKAAEELTGLRVTMDLT